MVGGSGSIAHSFTQYRELGAKTRAMLVAAAAARWNVSPDACRTEAGVVRRPSGPAFEEGEAGARRAPRRALDRLARRVPHRGGRRPRPFGPVFEVRRAGRRSRATARP